MELKTYESGSSAITVNRRDDVFVIVNSSSSAIHWTRESANAKIGVEELASVALSRHRESLLREAFEVVATVSRIRDSWGASLSHANLNARRWAKNILKILCGKKKSHVSQCRVVDFAGNGSTAAIDSKIAQADIAANLEKLALLTFPIQSQILLTLDVRSTVARIRHQLAALLSATNLKISFSVISVSCFPEVFAYTVMWLRRRRSLVGVRVDDHRLPSGSALDTRSRHAVEQIEIEQGPGLAAHSPHCALLALNESFAVIRIGKYDTVHSATAHSLVNPLRSVPWAGLRVRWTIPKVSRILRNNQRRTLQYDKRQNCVETIFTFNPQSTWLAWEWTFLHHFLHNFSSSSSLFSHHFVDKSFLDSPGALRFLRTFIAKSYRETLKLT